ncbi:hypothetical protein GOODEAATRI_015705 [Goodea atripinnis]|uniref:Uncharacterized protein n=1 Tax=Goodea atripinnis TaxID=208336 RepID=A0ABV0PYU4_9TELE
MLKGHQLIPLSSLLGGYQCVRHDEHISYGNTGDSVPPFGLTFSSEWLAHENAVFDIAWVPGEPQLVGENSSLIFKQGFQKLFADYTLATLAVFSGHQNSSFYVKSTISPDDQFLASGSSDNHTYIWKISDPQHPPMMLQGHNEEVTSVAWCPTDFTKVSQHILTGFLLAALPLPSNTTSTNRPIPVPVHQITPTSIRQWLSSTHESQSQVLRPCPLSPVSSSSPTERRAKRRLETGESSPSGCEDIAQCESVSELYPAGKRSCVLFDVCSPSQESSGQTDCHTESSQSITSMQAGKENCSPRAGNWLSEMGKNIKQSQGGPSAHKKRDGKTPTSSVSIEIPGLVVNSHSYSAFRLFSFFLASRNKTSCHGLLQQPMTGSLVQL